MVYSHMRKTFYREPKLRCHIVVFISALLILCTLFPSYGQSTPDDTVSSQKQLQFLETKARSFNDNHPSEKIFLHFDKTLYALGEDCWYKAYVVLGANLAPTDISSMVFIDWIDPNGNIIQHQRLKIENGSASGSFMIDTTHEQGLYHVRAYTTWMRNDDPEFFQHRTLEVFDRNSITRSTVSEKMDDKIDLQFFPEGGNLVYGIKTQIAFKATDSFGKGVNVKGQIVNQHNNVLSNFSTYHNGMGQFPMIPQPGELYHAILESGDRLDLPLPNGKIVMNVSNRNADKIIVRIQSHTGDRSRVVYLLGQSKGLICYAGYILLNSKSVDIGIPKKTLPQGVMQLTLFDSNKLPTCERMIFVKQDAPTEIAVTIKSDKVQYSPRDSIELTFNIQDKSGAGGKAKMSVSVTDADLVRTDQYGEDINTRLLLQSELKGLVENPAWYFKDYSTAKAHALDLLMITQGWSRYDWKKILSQEEDRSTFVPEDGLSLQGQLIVKDKPAPSTQIMIMAASVGNRPTVNTYQTDSIGNFYVSDLNVYDSTSITWWVIDKKGVIKNASIKINDVQDIPAIGFKTNHLPILPIGNEDLFRKLMSRIGNSNDDVKMLDEFVLKSSKITIKTVGANAIEIKPDAVDLKGRITTTQFIGRYAMHLASARQITMPDGTQSWGIGGITIDGWPIEMSGNAGNPLLILNAIPIDQIQRVIVSRGENIAIWTKPSSFVPTTKGTIKLKNTGYSVVKKFYHPKYDGESNLSSTIADNRITLYWNADLTTDENGIATIKFFNSDATVNFVVDAQGIFNGKPFTVRKVIGEVNPPTKVKTK